MVDVSEIPFLLALLDDNSPAVKEAVERELIDFGPRLLYELDGMPSPPDKPTIDAVKGILRRHQREKLREDWLTWFELDDEFEKLETAMALLADYQSGLSNTSSLPSLLDDIANEYSALHTQRDTYALADFLFRRKEFLCENENATQPAHCNLLYVLEEKRGIPITLACIYILVGHRLGLNIEGCSCPDQFFARVYVQHQVVLVDCGNHGQFVPERTILEKDIDHAEAIHRIVHADVPIETIVTRHLNNLVESYMHEGAVDDAELMCDLLVGLEQALT